MEVDGLGARCTLSSCRTLDYLPFTCPSCTRQFCSTHAQPASHSCRVATSRRVPTCPLCRAPVPVPAGSNVDIAVSRHIDQGCPRRARSNLRCSKQDCNVRDPVSTVCPSCTKSFCLAHRIESQHDCDAPRQNTTILGVSTIRQTRPNPKRSSSLRKRKVNFLNSPTEPIGDSEIPAENRIVVPVFFPVATKLKPRFMLFNTRHTSGRIIDELKRRVKDLPEPQGDRYYLYAYKKSGNGVNLLPYITPLKDLPYIVRNGDCLILENGNDGLDDAWMAILGDGVASHRKVTRSSHSLQNCTIS